MMYSTACSWAGLVELLYVCPVGLSYIASQVTCTVYVGNLMDRKQIEVDVKWAALHYLVSYDMWISQAPNGRR